MAILAAQTESSQPEQLHNGPALFAVLVLPYAFASGVTTLLMPYLLRKNGIAVDQIATIVAIALLSVRLEFPLVATRGYSLQATSWLLLAALGAGLAAASAILKIHGSKVVLRRCCS